MAIYMPIDMTSDMIIDMTLDPAWHIILYDKCYDMICNEIWNIDDIKLIFV